ncbi:MAG: hypothetical protein R3261_03085, partial [Alphaproteobacteria bacterium]|nr:hypothetical protein [Alphaproteobacteria bacterium]
MKFFRYPRFKFSFALLGAGIFAGLGFGAGTGTGFGVGAKAAEIHMVEGGHKPYVFPETSRGISVDIVREALAYRGHVLK